MVWRRLFFVFYLVVGTLLFLLVAVNLAIPGAASYFRLATGRANVRRAQVVAMRSHWNESTMSPGTYWDVSLTGGPLGHRTEELTLTQPEKKLLAAPASVRIGSWVPVVYLQGQWLPPPDAKLNGTMGVPILSLMALAVWGLILRGVLGPRALPEHYEPALADYGPNVTGFPTRRPLAIVCVLLVGFAMMVGQIFFKEGSYLGPGAHGAYWDGTLTWTLFLIAGPVVFWAALPRIKAVNLP